MNNKLKQEEEYIIEESQEFNLGENPLIQKFFAAFPALKHKNYQLYFTGQLISLTGTWLQTVAQGWLVLQLTHSAFWVGVVSTFSTLPVLIFSLFGGVIVDRFSKKSILFITQFSSFVITFILGILTIFNIINIAYILILSFLLGIINAIDMPTRQTFAVEMVGKEDLTSAIALNAGIFNGARVIGPGVAGLLISSFGTGAAFILNALSFLAVVFALFFINVQPFLPKSHPRPLKAIKEGIYYAYKHPGIRTLLIFACILSIFGWSYITLLPVAIEKIFNKGAAELGYLYSIAGLGAILGTIIVSAYSRKINPMFFILVGNLLFGTSLFLFTFTSNLKLAMFFLFFSGLGIIMQFSTMNSTIQHMVEDHIRGRVMSIYTFMFLGMTPIGSFLMGILAENFGVQFAIRLGIIVVLLIGGYLYINKKNIEASFLSQLKLVH